MAARSRSRLLITLALPPVLATYGIHRGLQALERRYPALPPEQTSSLALRAPTNPSTQFSPEAHIFAARVPLTALQERATHANPAVSSQTQPTPPVQRLTTAWAQAFLNNKLFRTEACAIGLLSGAGWHPGDLGDTPGEFSSPVGPDNTPRVLANGVFEVVRPPAEDDSSGLLVQWTVPDKPRQVVEKMARWGWPWRLVSGGRHELSISEPFGGDEEGGPFVEVRFSSAHNYEVVAAEGQHQKEIPRWLDELHFGYARLLLHIAARELRR